MAIAAQLTKSRRTRVQRSQQDELDPIAPRDGESLLILGLHLHVHLLHHVRGPAIDYVGVALAAFASWVGLPGPGEPVLIAAGVIAAKHKLDITPVVLVAWAGATAGGILGWAVGFKAGSVLVAPGPLQKLRIRAVARGERAFKRMEVVAIVLTPSWVAGINRSRARVYVPTTIVSALVLWALPIGVGAYYAGPPIVDVANDLGVVLLVGLGVLIAGAVIVELLLLRRRRAALRPHS